MKASVKFREEERKSPLIRCKVPISILGFPLVAGGAASGYGAGDLAVNLRTALSGGPSVKLSYRPSDQISPFSLTLRSGVGLWGSPDRSPLLLSAAVSLLAGTPPSFTIQIKPRIGDFSLKKTASSPNPNPSKANGGGVHHPIPVSGRDPTALREFLASGAAVTARTALPVTRRVGFSLRWGVNVSEAAVSGWRGLPYLTVDKMGIEVAHVGETKEEEPAMGGDVELVKGACFWVRREVEELQREQTLMRETVEEVRAKVLGSSGKSSSSTAIGGRGGSRDAGNGRISA